jgi:tRNA G18 (ribose-2'-O)-methylase SpoU
LAAIPVADLDDPRLALYRGVRDPELLRDHGAFVAEGRLVVERLLAQSLYPARSVLVTPAAHAGLARVLDRAACPVYLVQRDTLRSLAGFNLHRGCLAIGERRQPWTLDDLAAGEGPLVCLEGVANPDNIGGAFRNAAAFGASGVLLSPGCSDPLYRKSIRTSMGASLVVPFASAEEWPNTVGLLRARGWTIVALTPGAEADDLLDAVAALPASPLVLLLGHEGAGLTPAALAFASVRCRIPISSSVDSLNVAAAAAIALYEVTSRKSRQPSPGRPR